MLVSQILKDKGDLVFTASPHETMAAAAALLHSRRVGAMVIVDEKDEVAGILSERAALLKMRLRLAWKPSVFWLIVFC